MNSVTENINQSLAYFYTRHPYPKYPLIARPLWQHGVMAAPAYNWKVAHPGLDFPESCSVAILGCGEVLPYILKKWDKKSHFDAVDISKRSINRARFRLGPFRSTTDFHVDDVDHFLVSSPSGIYQHVDSYGVFHHLANPKQTLAETARVLKPGGTIRLMVYNRHARQWIRHFQKIFQLLKFSPFNKRSLEQASLIVRSALFILGRRDWAFALKPTFRNPTRFADTFMHVREAQLDISWWFREFKNQKLEIVSLLDRYGELDDLQNPFWNPPTGEQLAERALDRRFENNLELILRKSSEPEFKTSDLKPSHPKTSHPKTSYAKTSKVWKTRINNNIAKKSWWFTFSETVNLSASERLGIYRNLLNHMNNQPIETEFWQKIPLNALQRLARIGAILPEMITDPFLKQKLLDPIAKNMDIPQYETFNAQQLENILKMFAGELKKDPRKEKKMAIIAERLRRI